MQREAMYKIRVNEVFVRAAFEFDYDKEITISLTNDLLQAKRYQDKEEAIEAAKLCKRILGESVRVDVVSTQIVSETLIEEVTD